LVAIKNVLSCHHIFYSNQIATKNQPKAAEISRNQPKASKISRNQPKSAKISQNQPKTADWGCF
jgi:hypothetical protein